MVDRVFYSKKDLLFKIMGMEFSCFPFCTKLFVTFRSFCSITNAHFFLQRREHNAKEAT